MDPAQLYQQYFQTHLARDEHVRQLIYNVRYQVYCQEFGYESEQDCPGQMERDEYDAQSWHCLLRHRETGKAAGCIRLVQSDPEQPDRLLPFARFCAGSLDRARFDPAAHLPGTVAEFSRLAVTARFRRRQTDPDRPFGVGIVREQGVHQRSAFPVIPVALFVAGLSLLLASNADYGVAMMEPRLARMLRRFGILFRPIGQVVDYHGPRGPFVIHRSEVMPNLQPGLVALMAVIRAELFSAEARKQRRRQQSRLEQVFSARPEPGPSARGRRPGRDSAQIGAPRGQKRT